MIRLSEVQEKNANILRQEINSLLLKEAIQVIPAEESKKEFFSQYFLIPKKWGGIRPILDLRCSQC